MKKKKDINTNKQEDATDVNRLANALGHEIRNSLANLTNVAYLINLELPKILEGNPKSKVPKYLKILENSNKAIDCIIHNMLDFARTNPPRFSQKNLNIIIDDVIKELEIPQKIELNLELGTIPEVSVDNEEIRQAIKNLIMNAIESMEENEKGALTVRTAISNSGKQRVCMDVIDTGCGIPAENIEKIFETFFTTKSRKVGFGLAVVKKIIEQRHKGKVRIESTPKEGTTVHIELNKEV